ncbi:hypothetical protein [Nubsella zeaxanthinifaciens]|uniref:hypothetical protein n=1 Tax=Nubsella zeaxanthinifaciens TaxID=392412 RepID=UPI000DE31A21|nr:hypothetical protein [Nubsella zeaxanthinifaciens]
MNTVKTKIYQPSENGTGSGTGSGGDLSFNGERPISREVIGLKGVTPTGSNLKTVMENVLYPAVAPDAALTVNDPVREIGASTAYTLNWTVTKNTNPITGIMVDGIAVTPTGVSQSGTRSGNFPAAAGSFAKAITVTDGSQSNTKSVTVKFLARMWASNINKKTGITDADILALAGSELREDRFRSFTNFGGGGLYPIFVVPVAFGMPAFNVNGLTNTDFTVVRSNSPFVNANGATVMVNVIVFNNIYNSPLNSLAIV